MLKQKKKRVWPLKSKLKLMKLRRQQSPNWKKKQLREEKIPQRLIEKVLRFESQMRLSTSWSNLDWMKMIVEIEVMSLMVIQEISKIPNIFSWKKIKRLILRQEKKSKKRIQNSKKERKKTLTNILLIKQYFLLHV